MSSPNQKADCHSGTRSIPAALWITLVAAIFYSSTTWAQHPSGPVHNVSPLTQQTTETFVTESSATAWPVILLMPEAIEVPPEAQNSGNTWSVSESPSSEIPGMITAAPHVIPAAQWQGEPQNQILQGDNVMLPGEPPSPFETDIGQANLNEPMLPQAGKPWIIPISTQAAVWILPGDGDELGMTNLEFRQTFLFPRTNGWMVTPAFSTNFLNGPTSTDLPPTLYSGSIDFMWAKELSPKWKMNLAVAPGIYTDAQNTSSNAYRITGRAIFMWQMNASWQLAFGAVYLDRDDIVALPAVGAVYTPSESFRIEAIFPRPRAAWRLSQVGDEERWFYLAGELGGGTWAVERASGADDTLTYNALYLLAGYEIKHKGRLTPRFEAGYVFNRRVEYESNVGNFNPSSAAMIRVGLGF